MTPRDLAVWAVLAGVVYLAGYFMACALWPYTSCRRCKGAGNKRSPSGRHWRPCGRCKGSGTRVRTGRRVWNFLAGQRDRAS